MSISRQLKLTASQGTTWVAQPILYLSRVAVLVLVIGFVTTRVLANEVSQAVLEPIQEIRAARAQGKPPRQWSASVPLSAALAALCAFALWCFSLEWVDVRQMNGLGLVSALPISCFVALAGLTLGFCLILSARERVYSRVLLLYVLVLIFMLYATPALVEQAPRFQVTYWLAGHTEYILRNGAVDPYLDAYFNWPGFFVLTGMLTKIAGLQTVLALAPWASFIYNLLYLAPMYLIFRTATSDQRTIWLGLWFFYITDWVWQDYFDPQGLNFFFYLVILAILLKGLQTTRVASRASAHLNAKRWRVFSTRMLQPGVLMGGAGAWLTSTWARVTAVRPARIWADRSRFISHLRQWAALSDVYETPQQRRKRLALLGTLIAIFALSVVSHPITPFFVLLSVTALTLFGKIRPRWLPILMVGMILAWDFTAAAPYMAEHLRSDLATFGNIRVVASTNVTDRLAAGGAEHQFISRVRVLATAAIWGLAFLAVALRWRGNSRQAFRGAMWERGGLLFARDVTFLLLVGAPVFLVIAQPYGGEMAMRYYLFTLPIVSFFAAAAFRTRVTFRNGFVKGFVARAPHWFVARSGQAASIAVFATCLLLLGGFMFARYGNESADYITYDEANAVAYLYHVAPPHSLLLQGWTGTPWRYQDLEMYVYSQLYTGHGQAAAIQAGDISGVLTRASSSRYPAVYVIFTRSQKAQAQMFGGVSPVALEGVENALLRSGDFAMIYSNTDADILVYTHSRQQSALPNDPPATPQAPQALRGRS